MKQIFSSPTLGITVSIKADGSFCPSGQYEGLPIKKAFPICDGARCIILIDPDAHMSQIFENLLCIDRTGLVIWKSKLPSYPDVFVYVELGPDGVLTNTWSGFRLLLDENTGAELDRTFVK